MASKAVIDTLIAEAGGEGEAGLIAAAWAIQQRAAARGQTTDQVVRSGFDGFSKPGSGAVKAQADPAMRARVERIVTGVESGSIPNPVPGADHFLSGSVSPSWSKGMKLVATIGGHRFYASGNVPDSAQGGSVGTQLSVREAPVPNAMPASVTARRNQVTPVSRPVPKTNAGDNLAMNPVTGAVPAAPSVRTGPNGNIIAGAPTAASRNAADVRLLRDANQAASAVGGKPTERMVKSVPMPAIPGLYDTPAPPVVTRTAALAGSVQMAPGARPSVIPSTAQKPAVQPDPAYNAAGNPFKPSQKSDPAYNAPGNPSGRAPLVVTPPNQPAGSIVAKSADRLVSPGGIDPLGTKSVEIENPAYASMLRQIEAGTLIDSGGLSRDALALKKAGAAQAAAMLKAKLAAIPKTIMVQQRVRAPVTQRAPVVAKPVAPVVLTPRSQVQDDAAFRVNGRSGLSSYGGAGASISG